MKAVACVGTPLYQFSFIMKWICVLLFYLIKYYLICLLIRVFKLFFVLNNIELNVLKACVEVPRSLQENV